MSLCRFERHTLMWIDTKSLDLGRAEMRPLASELQALCTDRLGSESKKRFVYPYHFGGGDNHLLWVSCVRNAGGIEVSASLFNGQK